MVTHLTLVKPRVMVFRLQVFSIMAIANPYQVLGVTESASQDEIKTAYRGLAKKFHPDLNPGNKEAEKKFKEINQAYEMIGTPEQKAKFDRGEFDQNGSTGFTGRKTHRPYYYQTQEQPGGRYSYSFEGENNSDIFDSIFRGFSQRARSEAGPEEFGSVPGQDETYRLEIDLRDSILGAEKEVTFPNGKRLLVKIPQGVKQGSKLRFPGQGGVGIGGGKQGDVYVEIHIRPSDQFKVQGNDLVTELPISINEAVLGGEVRATTIDGAVLLKIPPNANTDKKLRIPGKGLFNRQNKSRGDQIVVLKVYLPENIDSDLKEIIQKWSDGHSYNPRDRSAA